MNEWIIAKVGKVFLTEECQLKNREEGMDFGNYQCMWT